MNFHAEPKGTRFTHWYGYIMGWSSEPDLICCTTVPSTSRYPKLSSVWVCTCAFSQIRWTSKWLCTMRPCRTPVSDTTGHSWFSIPHCSLLPVIGIELGTLSLVLMELMVIMAKLCGFITIFSEGPLIHALFPQSRITQILLLCPLKNDGRSLLVINLRNWSQ